MNLRTLQQKKAKLLADARAICDAVAPDADMTAEQTSAYDALMAQVANVTPQIERLAALEVEERATAAITPAAANSPVRIELGVDRKELDPKRGFASLGEYVQAVYGASGPRPRVDERLLIGAAAPGTTGAEGAGADGGFLVPPQFSTDIFRLTLTEDSLLPLTDQVTLGQTNSMVFPKDETTPWGTNGVRAYWQAEATAAGPTKPVLGTQVMRLHKLMALVPMTDELLADSSAAGSYIAPLFARSILWKQNEAILLGTGAGQPYGLLSNAGSVGSCAVVQAKESGQATLTVAALNIANMIARLPPGAYKTALWLVTPDAFPSIITLTLGNYPIYMPVSAGIQGAPYGMLMGRPIVLSQHVGAFSTQGDISLVAPDWYRTIVAEGGINIAQSLHLYFDADVTAFRATFRMDGAPKISAPIAQAKGSKTLSPAIALAAR